MNTTHEQEMRLTLERAADNLGYKEHTEGYCRMCDRHSASMRRRIQVHENSNGKIGGGVYFSCEACGNPQYDQFFIWVDDCPKCGQRGPHTLGSCGYNKCLQCGAEYPDPANADENADEEDA